MVRFSLLSNVLFIIENAAHISLILSDILLMSLRINFEVFNSPNMW